MEKGLELPAAFNTDPSSLSSEEIEAAGLEALPTTLAEALQALNHDSGPDITLLASQAGTACCVVVHVH